MDEWFALLSGHIVRIYMLDVVFLMLAALTVVLADGCSGLCIVVRAPLDRVTSSMEYSGSICGTGGQSMGRVQERLRIKPWFGRENDRKSVFFKRQIWIDGSCCHLRT